MAPLSRFVALGLICLLPLGCGGGSDEIFEPSPTETSSTNTASTNDIPADDDSSENTAGNNTAGDNNTGDNSAGDNKVYFTLVVDAVSSAMITEGCVFFVGDASSANSVSPEFCESQAILPADISDSAQGLQVSDGQCPTVVVYENVNFTGATETIDFCTIASLASACSNCDNSESPSSIGPTLVIPVP